MLDLIIFSLILINTILIYTVVKYRFIISRKINLIDNPSKEKIHRKPTPLLGGFLIYVTFNIFYLCQYLIGYFEINFLIFIISTALLIIGIFDDRKDLNYKIKFSIFIIIFILSLLLEENLVLRDIYFETFQRQFQLDNLSSIMLTLLCLLLLINATNLSDGINGLCIGIGIFWFVYISLMNLNILNNSILVISIILLILIFLNIYKGKMFLGNSGSHYLGSFFGLYFIQNYNTILYNENIIKKISVEEIFLVLMIPGVDMLRLFITRILNRKNPFKADRNHFHHHLIKNFDLNKSLTIYFLLLVMPIIFYKIIDIPVYLIIFKFVFIYLITFVWLNKKRTN